MIVFLLSESSSMDKGLVLTGICWDRSRLRCLGSSCTINNIRLISPTVDPIHRTLITLTLIVIELRKKSHITFLGVKMCDIFMWDDVRHFPVR